MLNNLIEFLKTYERKSCRLICPDNRTKDAYYGYVVASLGLGRDWVCYPKFSQLWCQPTNSYLFFETEAEAAMLNTPSTDLLYVHHCCDPGTILTSMSLVSTRTVITFTFEYNAGLTAMRPYTS